MSAMYHLVGAAGKVAEAGRAVSQHSVNLTDTQSLLMRLQIQLRVSSTYELKVFAINTIITIPVRPAVRLLMNLCHTAS